MTRMKQTNTRMRETNDRRRESGVKANSQMRRIIGGILGEQGKDRMYEEREAWRRKKGPAGQDKTKTVDKPAGLDGDENKDETEGQDEDGPAGWDETKTEDKPGGREGKVTKDRPAERGGVPTLTKTPGAATAATPTP